MHLSKQCRQLSRKKQNRTYEPIVGKRSVIRRVIQNSRNETEGVIVFDERTWRIQGDELTFGTEQQAFDHWRANYDPETGTKREQ